jgi:hypothetical protein
VQVVLDVGDGAPDARRCAEGLLAGGEHEHDRPAVHGASQTGGEVVAVPPAAAAKSSARKSRWYGGSTGRRARPARWQTRRNRRAGLHARLGGGSLHDNLAAHPCGCGVASRRHGRPCPAPFLAPRGGAIPPSSAP